MRDFFGKLIKTDSFGNRISPKQLKREVLAENVRKGKMAENNYVTRARMAGYDVERTGRGHDFKLSKTDMWTGKKKFVGYREIKSSSTAPVSKLQKATGNGKSNYKVIRENPGFF